MLCVPMICCYIIPVGMNAPECYWKHRAQYNLSVLAPAPCTCKSTVCTRTVTVCTARTHQHRAQRTSTVHCTHTPAPCTPHQHRTLHPHTSTVHCTHTPAPCTAPTHQHKQSVQQHRDFTYIHWCACVFKPSICMLK